jgi:hypothetical protein
MEPGGPFPHLQKPVTCPYPEPDQSNPYPQSHFLMISFNITLLYTYHRSSKWSLPLRLRHQNPVHTWPVPIHDPCPTLLHSSWYGRPNIWCWSLSAVGMATRNGLDSPGIESRWVWDFPHPPSLLFSGYQVFPRGKAARAWRWPPTPYLAPKLKKE